MRKVKVLLAGLALLAVAAAGCDLLEGRFADWLEADGDGPASGGPGSDLPVVAEGPGVDELVDDDPFFGYGELPPLTIIIGEADYTNRYAFTVAVGGRFVGDLPGVKPCSGVLVSPRLVLTAAHCLCRRTAVAPTASASIDEITPSTCAATGGVTASIGGSDLPGEERLGRSIFYEGEVRPHPELRILLDSGGAIVSSKADLAVVRLPRPMELPIAPVVLANDEIRPEEWMVVVGYPYHEGYGFLDDHRFFNREPVTGLLGSDRTRIQFGTLKSQDYKGDTGGPCLREEGGATTLVGITARGLGKEPTCIGTYRYRVWLEQEIALAAVAPVIERQEPPPDDAAEEDP